jgi:Flp pilus assembly protein TadG
MSNAGAILAIRGFLRRLGGDHNGVAAVEFALILPFMLTLYLGGAELGDGLAVQFRVTLAARTVADLTSQCGDTTSSGQYCDTADGLAIDSTTMSQILGAASTVMAPYSPSNIVVTVSELTFTGGSTTATVVWSASTSGNGRSIASSYPLPTAMQSLPANPNNAPYYVILGEVTYPYTPSLGYVITGTINMYQNALFFPRNSSCVMYEPNGTPMCA